MSIVDIALLNKELKLRVPPTSYAKASIHVLGESGLQIKIDGSKFLSSIGVWPNGCCDIEILCVATESSAFKHFEFGSVEEAIKVVIPEFLSAVEEAGLNEG